MNEIKSFKIFQTAKVIAVLYAITFTIFVAFALVSISFGPRRSPPPPHVILFLLPILGGIWSFIAAVFFCWLYNLITPYIGGIACELTPRS
jgi:hypothetical protein